MNRAFRLAEAPNQEQAQIGAGVSNSGQVYLRLGEFQVELKPDKAVEFAHGIMQAAQIAVMRRAAR